MTLIDFITFLGGGSLVAMLIVQGAKKLAGKIEGKWGTLATQVVLLIASLLVTLVFWAFQYLPAGFNEGIALIFGGAMVLYEVLYKAIWKQGIKGE